jgi:hypothetical protein
MDIKGTAIKTTREFVKLNFPTGYDAWIDILPEETRVVYASSILNMAGWYPLKENYQVPTEKIIEMFYGGNVKVGGEALGKFSADVALTGIYKLFLMVATPKYLMTRASVVFSTYYIPSEIKVSVGDNKSITLLITKFTELFPVLEYRIAGWCIRALELCGCKNVQYTINKSLLNGNPYTEYLFSWE